MIDGVDGLAGVTCLVTASLIAVAAAYAGNWRLSIGMLLVDGALAAFLLFNLRTPWNPRATLFLGNAGADLLGLVIAAACFRLTQNGHHPVGTQLAPFLLALPVVDCMVLMVRRARAGKSPFVGDRNHFHHLLWDAGYSANAIVAIIAGSTALLGILAAVALKLHAPAPLFTLAFVALLIGHFRFTHVRERAVANLAKARLAVLGVLPGHRAASHLAHHH
jgi:UDP-GlcNAc:undecaprenyl-phosphate GlcNAc-1-phosphate transferase